MGKRISIGEATLIAERDDVGECESCVSLAEDDDLYCRNCRSYWNDCEDGLWDEEWGEA